MLREKLETECINIKKSQERDNGKINVKIPEPKDNYDTSNQKQINRSITTLIEQLNSTFLDEVKQEQERFSWFISG